MNYISSLTKVLKHPLNKDHKNKALWRIIWWKCNQLFFHIPSMVQLTPEMKCICYPESSYGSLIVYTTFPEFPEMDFLYRYLKSGDIFFDIGANIGAISLLAASRQVKKIYAWEPSPAPLQCFYQNIKLNNLENIIFVREKVVSDHKERVPFTIGAHSETDHIAYSSDKKQSLSIQAETLDSFISSQGLSFIDFVKIDVEGAELKVLKGLEENLHNGKIGVLIVEINKNSQQFGYSCSEIISYLEKRNFLVYYFDGLKLKRLQNFSMINFRTFNIVAAYRTEKVLKRLKPFLK
jgi:FkbM family methyltransferase